MKSFYLRIVFLIILSTSGVFISFWMKTPAFGATAIDSSSPHAALQYLIAVAPPSLHVFSLHYPWTGTVSSKSHIHLTAMVSGRIESVEVADQARVEKGNIVMRLGGAQVDEQRSRLASEVTSLEARVALAGQVVERLKQNLQTHLATKDQLAAAQDRHRMLAAQLEEAGSKRKAFAREVAIVAPTDGTFTNRQVSVGQEVSAGDTVGDIVDTAHLRIVASLFIPPGTDLLGREATVHLDGGRDLSALVTSVLPLADGAGATQVWMESAKVDKHFHPGQSAAGFVEIKTGTASLAVPRSAIVYNEQEQPILFFRQNGTYEECRIRTGITEGGLVQVLSGLPRDRMVVVRGAYELYYRTFNRQFKVQD